MKHKWEIVHEDREFNKTHRMRIDGGWLYKYENGYNNQCAMTYAPYKTGDMPTQVVIGLLEDVMASLKDTDVKNYQKLYMIRQEVFGDLTTDK